MSTPPPAAAGDAVPNLSISIAGKIMMSGVVIFFFLFVFLLIFFLRANRYMGASPALASTPARFVLPVSGAAFPRRTLDLAVLRSLPVTIFSSVAFKDGMECSVCLTELADGDATRFLPGCRHGFHLECIDMWFGSNSTCPICRSSVELPAAESKNMILVDSEQSSTINNRALEDETVIPADGSGEGSSSSICSVSRKGNGIMAIDIPRIGLESSAFALHSSRILAAVEVKSPNLASLRSLRRVLSMGSRGFGSACSSRGWDAEQGVGSDGGEGCSSNKNCQRDLSLVEEAFFVKDGKRIAMR